MDHGTVNRMSPRLAKRGLLELRSVAFLIFQALTKVNTVIEWTIGYIKIKVLEAQAVRVSSSSKLNRVVKTLVAVH